MTSVEDTSSLTDRWVLVHVAGNLHYFSLSVPSLRLIAAKFASEDYEAIKNLWSNAYDAIERKKRMGYPY